LICSTFFLGGGDKEVPLEIVECWLRLFLLLGGMKKTGFALITWDYFTETGS